MLPNITQPNLFSVCSAHAVNTATTVCLCLPHTFVRRCREMVSAIVNQRGREGGPPDGGPPQRMGPPGGGGGGGGGGNQNYVSQCIIYTGKREAIKHLNGSFLKNLQIFNNWNLECLNLITFDNDQRHFERFPLISDSQPLSSAFDKIDHFSSIILI